MSTLYDHRGRPVDTPPPPKPTPDKENAEMGEVAYAQKDDLGRAFANEIRQPDDDVLKRRSGAFLEAYKKLKRDDQIKSTLQQRRTAVVSRDWTVEPGASDAASRSAADWLRDMLEHVGWHRVARKMHWGLFYGYAVAELMYERDGAYIGVDAIKVRDRSRFRFGRDFELRLVGPRSILGEEMPARKFWVMSTGADHDDEVYGLGLAHFLYWPVYFKRNGVRIWLNTLETAARGAPYGTYPQGAPEEEQKKLLQALQIMKDGGAAIWPEGMGVDTLDLKSNLTSDNKELYNTMDRAISKIVLSQTLTTDAQSTGLGSTLGDVQQVVAEQVQQTDADLLTGSFCKGQPHFEGPLKWLMEWNFPDAEMPVFKYDTQTKTQADDNKPEQPSGGGSGASPVPGVDLAAEPTDRADTTVPTRVTDEIEDEANAAVGSYIEQVRNLMQQVDTLPELRDRLVELYPDMDTSTLSEVMGRAMTASHALGRAQVLDNT